MAFSTATITSGPEAEDDGGSTLVSWTCSDAAPIFQLYVNRSLAWAGTAYHASLPMPITRTVYQVGTVAAGEEKTDFSGSLPLLQGTGDRAELNWQGGSWEEAAPPGSGLAGFRVYGSATPGGSLNYATPLADLAAYLPGLASDGYGEGGYGSGGYGGGSGTYWWTSLPLSNGAWTFSVKPYDHAGNEGLEQTITVTIARPPDPPPRDPITGQRLALTYDLATKKATLSWLASPG